VPFQLLLFTMDGLHASDHRSWQNRLDQPP